jgi:hypothetical protein
MPRSDTADLRPASPLPALAAVAAAIASGGELVEATRLARKRPENILGLLLRDLTREEIAVMEDRGCRCDDWTKIQVAQDFDAFRVRRTRFQGHCVIGRFHGDVMVQAGISMPSGVFDATLINCQIGNGVLVENVRFTANVVVDHGAVLYDVGAITCGGAAVFGIGQDLPLGVETGGREVPLWAECTIDQLAAVARDRGDHAGLESVRRAVTAYTDAVRSPVTWVRRGARIRHTTRVHDAYVGAGAVVDHALALENAALLSSADEPVSVVGGAAVTDAIVQWGVTVAGNAIVRHAALLEHAAVDEHATVEGSAIGPNTTIAKGEVTASLVGPFVGFHHQSLLIAALWPEGKGNIAYGAMVGSNHTGRAPDQEIWPGEGVFYGLGCAVRFPADYSGAPYSVISMGVTTLPQRVSFPFSLIAVPVESLAEGEAVPRAFNEIVPGWALAANAYGIARMELKFAKRDKARRHTIDYKVFRPGIMRQVHEARARLMAVGTTRTVYLDSHIDGLGRNFLRESARLDAIRIYGQALTRYALRILLGEREGRITIPGSAEIAHALADELVPGDFPSRMQRLVEIERDNARLVEESKARDDERGERVIPGYRDAHQSAHHDPVVRSAWERVTVTERRVSAVL